MPAPAPYDRIDELAPDFGGLFLQPHDDGYEAARRVHNGLIDKRPALIARCSGVADIMAAIELAHKLNLDIAVRGGGHNVAGPPAQSPPSGEAAGNRDRESCSNQK